jgi:predicted Fe-Mo cluster-binding NifX family protein
MNTNSIRFAFAVDQFNSFKSRHFGDAEKYLIYEWNDNEIIFLKEEINRFKDLDEEQTHGSKKKGEAIIDFLKGLNINVLVSRQFGRNIQLVNRHFIPVIVFEDIPGKAITVLTKHIKWIVDELNNKPVDYKLFTLKNGVLKTSIKKE